MGATGRPCCCEGRKLTVADKGLCPCCLIVWLVYYPHDRLCVVMHSTPAMAIRTSLYRLVVQLQHGLHLT